ncbi:MAG: ribose-5-phosphate isomerase [Candidatus Ryanbacteria bacterium CG10_big_fil_rev_8_21_14_0_10_43_42]|uniref:Ribose-5-phosphate isomerase n=1 Tax=Candidatus Ryanbacteria bacterium CG10_big_fil_rev_8_21_14_0_10_43_42 TaxID=1974864 RepID=A0A2M8KX32_9BACT|nr:MAG: ribose-5-phosphate isomerase [Candidatus Ryanbacteria bacterium CG10_big_fil_rev_8_21_14_0_10_43_42]
MKIYLGADHAGFPLKERIRQFLVSEGYATADMGANRLTPGDDYPDYIAPVAKKVSEDPIHARGIILGASGQGEAMMANRFPHVRAAVWYGKNERIITLSREHNDANILSLGALFVHDDEAVRAVELWLETPFSGDERHKRRIDKIDNIL